MRAMRRTSLVMLALLLGLLLAPRQLAFADVIATPDWDREEAPWIEEETSPEGEETSPEGEETSPEGEETSPEPSPSDDAQQTDGQTQTARGFGCANPVVEGSGATGAPFLAIAVAVAGASVAAVMLVLRLGRTSGTDRT